MLSQIEEEGSLEEEGLRVLFLVDEMYLGINKKAGGEVGKIPSGKFPGTSPALSNMQSIRVLTKMGKRTLFLTREDCKAEHTIRRVL